MKYICTKTDPDPDNPNGEKEIFLFPEHLEFADVSPLIRIIRNQTYGNWKRINRNILSHGSVRNNVFISSLIKTDPPLITMAEADAELYKKQLTSVCKYIVVKVYLGYEETEVEEIYIFPSIVNHNCFYEAINNQDDYREIVSAGFVDKNLTCQGYSESLGVKSRPEDTKLLKKEMSI